MTKSFNCASCSAPLEFEGTPTQECPFCGGTVIAPAEMFAAGNLSSFGFNVLTDKALAVAEVKRLIESGKKIEAIKVFREAFGVGLKEARDAVDAIERGEGVGVSGTRIRTSGLTPEALDAAKKVAITSIGGFGAILFISIILIVGGVGAILYFTFAAVQNAEEAKTRSTARPLDGQEVSDKDGASDTTELIKFGGEGSGPAHFKDNRHVAVDGQGRIYSSDYSPHKIQVFDPTGKFITQWRPGKGSNLYGLTADRAGNVYLANDKGLFKFAGETGDLLAAVEQISPRGVALSGDGKVVVTARKSLMIYDKDLKLVTEIKDAAERASSVFGFDAITVDGDGSIFVFDRQNGDICKFSADGKFLNRFPTGTVSAHALAIDSAGRLFISNTSNILVFDSVGRRLREFDTFQAFGLAFDIADNLFIATRPYVTKLKLNF